VAENRPTLVLFARAPVPGRVKTRLAESLGPEGAARLYRAFLEDAARAYPGGAWTASLHVEGDPADPVLAAIFGPEWERERQSGGDLGRRLSNAFEIERARGAPIVLFVGSDHPALTRTALGAVLEAVERGADAALVPAADGGYCAIALSRHVDPEFLFEGTPWSTANTLEWTLERARAAGLRVSLLPVSYDVDRVEDLSLLRADLEARDPSESDYPRSTAAALADLARRLPA
jgi:rSAM/selenodomain-associated transferase 1